MGGSKRGPRAAGDWHGAAIRNFAASLAASALTAGAVTAAPCALKQTASLPATFHSGYITIDASVNGTTGKFVIDTGSSITSISAAFAKRLNLPTDLLNIQINGTGGTYRPYGALISEFKIGQAVAPASQLMIRDNGGDGTTDQYVGIIAQDYLANFDMELDPAGSRVNLFASGQCPDVVYWSDEHFELPIVADNNFRPIASVMLDGKEFHALIDTAAAESSIDLGTARLALNINFVGDAPKPPIVGRASRADNSPPEQTYAFNELVFGPITIRHPNLKLTNFRTVQLQTGSRIKETVNGDTPVIIGMDILKKFHSVISYRSGKISFTLANEKRADGVSPKP